MKSKFYTCNAPALTVMLIQVLALFAVAASAGEIESTVQGNAFLAAKWIAPPPCPDPLVNLPLFRKEFTLPARPKRATLRIVGLGDYDARVNGTRLAETGINQPWSQYENTIYYHDYEIGPLVRRGANCVGVMLLNSFWHNPNPPKGRYNKDGPQRSAPEPLLLCAEVTCEFADGTVQQVGTDETWRTTGGPVIFSHVFAGEDFDACRQQRGWEKTGFDDSAWQISRCVSAPTATLLPQTWPPFKTFDRFSPESVREAAPGVFTYSFPQNCSAQLRVELEGGKRGDRVSFRCGEHRNAQDRLFGGYIVGCDVISDGKRVIHQWLSFYLGMQFVEVTGAVPKGRPNPKGLPVIRSLELVHTRTALPEAGTLECSSDLFNRTHRLIDWAMRANTSHVLSDCPHREKLGWLECAYLLAPSFEYRYDCRSWFDKLARDIRDAQEASGRVLTVAPSYPAGRFPGAFNWTVEWGAAAVLLPWAQYEWTGDTRVLADNFEMMRRFTDYVQSEAKEGLAPGGLGDWYDYGHGQPPGPSRFTPTQLSATATWGLCALTVSRAAEVLGRAELAEQYRDLHAHIAADFQKHFRDAASGGLKHAGERTGAGRPSYLGSPQCANAMAICAEVVPVSDRAMLIDEMITDLQKRGWQQTPGDIGHVYFIRALAENGRSDVLHRIYAREGKGSYGGILAKGLTSMPETWDAMMDGYQSLDHCMLGHVIEWFYGYVGGIRQAPGTTGWKHIVVGPNPGPLSWARTTLNTPAGRIASQWRVQNGSFRLDVEIPKGVTAKAILPSGRSEFLGAGKRRLTEEWH